MLRGGAAAIGAGALPHRDEGLAQISLLALADSMARQLVYALGGRAERGEARGKAVGPTLEGGRKGLVAGLTAELVRRSQAESD
jgi:hypothetical protein